MKRPDRVIRHLQRVIESQQTYIQSLLEANGEEKKSKLHLLIIDDSQFDGRILANLVECMGAQGRVVNHGELGFRMAFQQRYDAIFLDCMMEPIGGHAICRAIKKSDQIASIPVIGMSSDTSAENKLRCLQSGMNQFIEKPFRRHDIFIALQEVLNATF